MIALLSGEVAVRRADHVVVLCGQVGYRAAVSAETLRHVPPAGEHVTLQVQVKKIDHRSPLYSVWNPATSSLSASRPMRHLRW